MNDYKLTLEKLINKKNLTSNEATDLMQATMSGKLTASQISAWLIALRCKGETSSEVAIFASVMRSVALSINVKEKLLIDTCGTGGDNSNLINVSTLSSIALASLGYKVAKHGNRSVSSRFGSADILEKLNYPLNENNKEAERRIVNQGFAFMFAPVYHPAMKFAIEPRKELKVRTVFNILGPLSNPASAKVHLMGVYNKDLQKLMAESLLKLKIKTAMVVHSEEGLDEISPIKNTYYYLINEGKISKGLISAKDFNLKIKSLKEIQVSNPSDLLSKTNSILDGKFRAGIEMVSLNTVAAMYLHALAKKQTKLKPQTYIKKNIASVIEHLHLANLRKITNQWP